MNNVTRGRLTSWMVSLLSRTSQSFVGSRKLRLRCFESNQEVETVKEDKVSTIEILNQKTVPCATCLYGILKGTGPRGTKIQRCRREPHVSQRLVLSRKIAERANGE